MAAVDASTKLRIARSAPLRGPVPPPRRPHPTRPEAAPLQPALTRPVAVTLQPERTRTDVVGTRILPSRPDPLPEPVNRPRRSHFGLFVGALTAGLATGAAVAALGVTLPGTRTGPATAELVTAVDRLGAASTSRTLTTTFTDTGSSVPGFGDRVTYRAVGTAAATVDLTRVGTSDVRITGTSATVHVPSAQLGTPTLDRSQSGIVGRRKGIATDLLGTEISIGDLESQGVTALTDRANAVGLPGLAEQTAVAEVRSALRRLGIRPVTVTFDQGS